MTSSASKPPRILVADDDAVSLQFLALAVRELGCLPTAVTDGSGALAACAVDRFDLLLLDRRMPDIGGAPLLFELRAAGIATPAIATSAELDAPMRHELMQAGYAGTLTKPVGLSELAELLNRHIPAMHAHAGPGTFTPMAALPGKLLDDDQALMCTGTDIRILRSLRNLFAEDLRSLLARLASAGTPMTTDEQIDALHRLRAACRYCGAGRLATAAERLESRLRQNDPLQASMLTEFVHVGAATLTALDTDAAGMLLSDQPSVGH